MSIQTPILMYSTFAQIKNSNQAIATVSASDAVSMVNNAINSISISAIIKNFNPNSKILFVHHGIGLEVKTNDIIDKLIPYGYNKGNFKNLIEFSPKALEQPSNKLIYFTKQFISLLKTFDSIKQNPTWTTHPLFNKEININFFSDIVNHLNLGEFISSNNDFLLLTSKIANILVYKKEEFDGEVFNYEECIYNLISKFYELVKTWGNTESSDSYIHSIYHELLNGSIKYSTEGRTKLYVQCAQNINNICCDKIIKRIEANSENFDLIFTLVSSFNYECMSNKILSSSNIKLHDSSVNLTGLHANKDDIIAKLVDIVKF